MAVLFRRPTKFTSIDGTTTVYTFPIVDLEWDSNQEVRTAYGIATGAHYGHDFLGFGSGIKAIADERIRFAVLRNAAFGDPDDEIDNLKSKLFQTGLGKLWTADEAAAEERWAYARIAAMPSLVYGASSILRSAVSVNFARLSDWYDEVATAHTEVVTASPDTFNVTNPGNATVHNAVIRFRANATGGFSAGFTLENLTTSQSFSSARASASANSEVKVDCGALTVEYSNDNGANYVDDMANFTRGANQVAFMDFAPGVNSIRATVGGTENVNIDFDFSGAWS